MEKISRNSFIDVTDKIEHPSTFIGRSLWVNRRSWPRKAIGHRVLPSIYRSFTIRPRLPLKTFVGDVNLQPIRRVIARAGRLGITCNALPVFRGGIPPSSS